MGPFSLVLTGPPWPVQIVIHPDNRTSCEGCSTPRYTKPGVVGDSSAMVTPTPRTSLLSSWVRRCASPRLELSIEPCVKRTVSVYARLKNLGGRLELRALTDPIKTRLPRMGMAATRTVNDVSATNSAC